MLQRFGQIACFTMLLPFENTLYNGRQCIYLKDDIKTSNNRR